MRARLLTICASLLLATMTACSGPGINAGRQGGIAFIWFAIMLFITGAALWFFIGRED